jgi:membrane protein
MADEIVRPPTADDGVKRLSRLPFRLWWSALKRTGREFLTDNLSDWAAALTYYSVLSIFPGLLLMITLLRLAGTHTTEKAVANLTQIAPDSLTGILSSGARNLLESKAPTAGLIAIVSLLAALWSASGYVGAFIRASNAIYDVPEGRPIWKTFPIRLGITIFSGIMLTAAALIAVLTGKLAEVVGRALGLEQAALATWSIAKWPILVAIISLLWAVLYWASPNVKHGGFRWVTPGGALAVILWALASAGFGLYVANFASYNKTYGSLATVIVFLVWLWISNLAILLGAEFDAELQRSRAIEAGHPPADEPYMSLRDERTIAGDGPEQVSEKERGLR